jgi:streptogramin lyase
MVAIAVMSTAVIVAGAPGVARANALQLFSTPHAAGVPVAIAAGPGGVLWLTDDGPYNELTDSGGPGGIDQISTAGHFGHQFVGAGAGAGSIAQGPDGRMWFPGAGVQPDVGAISAAGVASTFMTTSTPQYIAAGPDGRMWFTEFTPTNGGPAVGPDMIGAITTSGTLSEYTVPKTASNVTLGGIAAGRDGRLWFTEQTQDANGNNTGGVIAAITTSGTVTAYPIPAANRIPGEIVAGPDGALWFTQTTGTLDGCPDLSPATGGCKRNAFGHAIASITTTGAITPLSTVYGAGDPFGIAAGPDGRIWFTTPPNEIDAITTAGSQSRYYPPGGDSSEINYGIGNIAPGADGRLWFAVGGGNAGAMGAISTGGKVSVPPTNGKGTLPGHSICVVPRLIGKKLAVARRALSAAHCRLGKVSKRKHRGTPGRVLSQRPKPGTKRPASSKVTVVESRR